MYSVLLVHVDLPVELQSGSCWLSHWKLFWILGQGDWCHCLQSYIRTSQPGHWHDNLYGHMELSGGWEFSKYYQLCQRQFGNFITLTCQPSEIWKPIPYCMSLYPPLQRSWKGGILVSPCPSVRLSVCGQNRVRSVSSTILIGSISYLHILSSNFRRCVACNARFKIEKFEILANFLNLQLWLCLLLTCCFWSVSSAATAVYSSGWILSIFGTNDQ